MIASHRARHRRIFWTLAILLPVLLFLALRARPTWPRLESSPPEVDGFKEVDSRVEKEAVTFSR